MFSVFPNANSSDCSSLLYFATSAPLCFAVSMLLCSAELKFLRLAASVSLYFAASAAPTPTELSSNAR